MFPSHSGWFKARKHAGNHWAWGKKTGNMISWVNVQSFLCKIPWFLQERLRGGASNFWVHPQPTPWHCRNAGLQGPRLISGTFKLRAGWHRVLKNGWSPRQSYNFSDESKRNTSRKSSCSSCSIGFYRGSWFPVWSFHQRFWSVRSRRTKSNVWSRIFRALKPG